MLSIRVDLREVQRALGDVGQQVPFATALALTTLAAGVQQAEVAEESKVFDKTTPFTRNAFAKKPATKRDLVATVFIKNIRSDKGYSQEDYFEPYVVGGDRFINDKKAMLRPAGTTTNQYGNLTKGQLKRLKAKPNVFIGKVTFRSTGRTVSGVWQRSPVARGRRRDDSYGNKGDSQGKVHGARTTLKLLIEFEDTTPVKKRFDFEGRARAYVARNARPVFNEALAKAMTPKRG